MASEERCDRCADRAIAAMLGVSVALGVVPPYANWALFFGSLCFGVAAIGFCYDAKLTSDEGWKLTRQAVEAVGLPLISLNIASKIFAAAITTGVWHTGAMALDAGVSAATALAAGKAAKAYFRGERDNAKLGIAMRD